MKIFIILMAVCGFALVLSQIFRKKVESKVNVCILQATLGALMVASGITALALNVC